MPPVLVCLLALEIKTGIRAAGVQGPGAEFSQRASASGSGKSSRAAGPQRSAAQAVALHAADRRSKSEGQKANRKFGSPWRADQQQQRRRRFRSVRLVVAPAAPRRIGVAGEARRGLAWGGVGGRIGPLPGGGWPRAVASAGVLGGDGHLALAGLAAARRRRFLPGGCATAALIGLHTRVGFSAEALNPTVSAGSYSFPAAAPWSS